MKKIIKVTQPVEVALMIEDLDKSGIGEEYIDKLGLITLSREETATWMKGEFDVPTYEIPYFNAAGERTGYSRLKNLETKRKFGKKNSHKPKQAFKYLQRPNTAPHLYIPNVYDWPKNEDGKIIVDKLVITEGEKKAIKACLTGIPCVALGGVDSFKSAKRGILLLEEFDDFDLEVTDIEICYDSDLNTNESVRRAMHTLGSELLSRNPASIGYVMLDGESTDDGKLGLDDFLLQYDHADDARHAFAELPRKIDKRQDIMALLDTELCYMRPAGKLYNILDDRYYNSDAALVTDYGPKYKVPDPEDNRKQIPAVKLWLEHRGENTWCDALVYEPGKARRYRPDNAKNDHINLWRPSKVKPVEGDVTLWLELVRYVMGSAANYKWFLQWLAYPIQYPGSKLLTAVFVYSRTNGVGKNFIIDPLVKEIYGPSYKMIGANDLEDDFNDFMKCSQFVFGEEIYMSDKRDRETTMGSLKALITNNQVNVNIKFRPKEVFRNCAQLYLTSNHGNALALDPTDRRVLVVHAPEQPWPQDKYDELDAWCKEPDSAGKLLSYLLHKVDVSQFNINAAAPMTDDKEEIIEQGRDMIQSYVSTLASNPKDIYQMNGKLPDQNLFTTQEIFQAINNHARSQNMPELRITPDSLGRYLSNGKTFPRRRLNITKNYRSSVYAIFNKKKWNKSNDAYWIAHFQEHSARFTEKKPSKIEGGAREKAEVIDLNERRDMKK